MNDVAALLAAFRDATGREAAIWERRSGAARPALVAASSPAFAGRTEAALLAWDVPTWGAQHGCAAHLVSTGEQVGWLLVEPGPAGEDRLLGRILPLVRRLMRERDGATAELAERYEEITLLYTIGELLGTGASVESVAGLLLRELAITVGASSAAFLLADDGASQLVPVATLGIVGRTYPAVAADDPQHAAARAWRRMGSCADSGARARRADPVLGRDGAAILAVAITRGGEAPVAPGTAGPPFLADTGEWPAVRPEQAPLGVVVLGGRPDGRAFSAGDRKLVTAVMTQVGTALHNARLVHAALERERLAREMRLAAELQLKLLPDPGVVGPEARAAARVVAAESVGGDFYLLARLDAQRTVALIGDVAGHGYQAALVMALALSAAAIHAQGAGDPAQVVEAVRRSLADELATTDMSLSLCCAVIDAGQGTLRWANAGHPHAFRIGPDGEAVRLEAHGTPLGFGGEPKAGAMLPWRPGDRLLLFTDGAPDARDARGNRLGEAAVLAAAVCGGPPLGAEPPAVTCARIADRVLAHADGVPLRDDFAVLVVDRVPEAAPPVTHPG